MLDLARHIVEQKSGHFEPERPITAAKAAPSNVVNLMDALRASLGKKTTAAERTSDHVRIFRFFCDALKQIASSAPRFQRCLR